MPAAATVKIADRLVELAMKADPISLAIHRVTKIASADIAEPVAMLADELTTEVRELGKKVHPY
jgi:hypothetical protein